MKRKLLFIISLLFSSFLVNAHNSTGSFSLSTSKPIVGQTLKFTYNPTGSMLDTSKPIYASIYEYTNYKWTVKDVVLKTQGSKYKGEIALPNKCAFAALKFYQGNFENPEAIDNNNNQGFIINPVTSKDKKNPGAAIGIALLKMPSLGSGLLNYVTDSDEKLDSNILSKLLDEEAKITGSDVKNYIRTYINIQKEIKGEQFSTYISQWLNKLLKRNDLSENELREIQTIYKFTLKNTPIADSLRTVILQKYPKGGFARLEAFGNRVNNSKNPKDIIASYQDFLKKFPYADWLKNPNEQEFIYYGTYRMLSSLYFETRNFDAFMRIIPQMNFKTLTEMYRWNIEKNYIVKHVPEDSLIILARPLMDAMLNKIDDGSMATNGIFSMNHAIANAHSELDKRLVIHIGLLSDLGFNDEALSYFKYLNQEKLLTIPELNDTHLKILENMHANKAQIKVFIESCVSKNAVSPKMFEKLKSIYLEEHSDPNNFESYISSLKSINTKETLKEMVRKDLMNVKYTPFELEDIHGNILHSSDWKDKIIVLDFWATWCSPCIKALPSMQLVVDKYSNDPNVDFFFIGTMQNGDYRAKTVDFIKKEGFRMNFTYDGINPKSGKQNAIFSTFAPIFNSSGIPRKVILKDGYIRYTTEGYSGSASQLSDEISYAIELLKNE